MRNIRVNGSSPYEIVIGSGIVGNIGELLRSIDGFDKILLVSDDNVMKLYGKSVENRLKSQGFDVKCCIIPHGEDSKSFDRLKEITEAAASFELMRNDIFLALGGGVVGDITGFAASIYMRGIRYVSLPTTLLSAVDASVGGKTAIDLAYGKNLVGSFWQPSMVVCDTDIIHALPSDVFVDGMAEVIKHGILGDKKILDIAASDKAYDMLEELIYRNVKVKLNFVCGDEHDRDKRRYLNFGHTYGHALEKLCEYKISHGKAVGCGMICEAKIGEAIKACRPGFAREIADYCKDFAFEEIKKPKALIIDAMAADKKNSNGLITFSLPDGNGGFSIRRLSRSELNEIL